VSLIVALGPASDRSRLGVGLDVGRQWFWHEGPYYYDVDDHIAPLATVALNVAWTRPFVGAAVTALGGALYPWRVGDGGFQPLAGAQVGAGVGLSTDGSAGPVFAGEVLGPWSDVRFDVSRSQGAWHAPRLSLGLDAELNCCSYLDKSSFILQQTKALHLD
jgi:hypothetical protein